MRSPRPGLDFDPETPPGALGEVPWEVILGPLTRAEAAEIIAILKRGDEVTIVSTTGVIVRARPTWARMIDG